jgi:solute carrier family 35 protein E1
MPVTTRRSKDLPAGRGSFRGASDSVALLLFFVFWYVGNAFYNQFNTQSINAVGGKLGGLTMTVATMQLGVCTLYALLLWVVGLNPIKIFGLQMPEKMAVPKITTADVKDTLPVGVCSAVAHSAGVFCLGADPLFGQSASCSTPPRSPNTSTHIRLLSSTYTDESTPNRTPHATFPECNPIAIQ